MKPTLLFKQFFESEKSSGIILIAITILSLLVSNSTFGESYCQFWHQNIGNQPIEFWVNDGLMTVFFLLIGLELEREVYIGELSNYKKAIFPFVCAIGGMVVPALIYFWFNFGTSTQNGFGIPMATDIAFALAILSLLGNKVPTSVKIFLTALAVIDDLGAIIVIAIFYSKNILWINFLTSLGIFAILLIFNRLKIKNIFIYLFGGFLMWLFMLNSGIHATITGVLLAFALPFGNGDKKSTSYVLQKWLHAPVAFFILPLFALANTSIKLNFDWIDLISQNYSLGIFFGLILGKPIGIVLFALLFKKIKILKFPNDINFKILIGMGFLAGIGFTMSIFITLLAIKDSNHINNAKIVILCSSLIAGIVGFFVLKKVLNLNDKN